MATKSKQIKSLIFGLRIILQKRIDKKGIKRRDIVSLYKLNAASLLLQESSITEIKVADILNCAASELMLEGKVLYTKLFGNSVTGIDRRTFIMFLSSLASSATKNGIGKIVLISRKNSIFIITNAGIEKGYPTYLAKKLNTTVLKVKGSKKTGIIIPCQNANGILCRDEVDEYIENPLSDLRVAIKGTKDSLL